MTNNLSTPIARAIVLGAYLVALPATPAGAQQGEARDTVVWNRAPIHVTLAVGQQRRVTFPGPVLFGQVPALQGTLEVQNVHDTLYLTANDAIEPTQVLVRACVMQNGSCVPEGEVYLLALTAKASAPAGRPLFVEHALADDGALAATSDRLHSAPDPIALVRHAAQQLYTPERLLRERADTSRVPIERASIDHLYVGGAFTARPLAAWSNGQHYVTALELRNNTPTPQAVDVRAIRGRWQSRTLVAGLALTPPRGGSGDRTTVFLLSPVPFGEAITWPR